MQPHIDSLRSAEQLDNPAPAYLQAGERLWNGATVSQGEIGQ